MNRTHLFLLGLILAFATALRAYHLSDLGYWTDELCTLSAANGHGLQLLDVPTDRIAPPLPVRTRRADAAPITGVIPGMARDETHPPLYPLAVRLWADVFGESESAVRSLGVACSVVAIALLYLAAVSDVGPAAALWACLLMAVATPQVQFAQEARNYVPAMMLTLAAAAGLNGLRRRPTVGRAVTLTVVSIAAVLTHYYAAIAIVALATRTLSLRGRARWLAWRVFAVAAVACAILCGPLLLRQRSNLGSNTAWLIDATPGHAGRVLADAVRLPVRWVADAAPPNVALAVGIVALLSLLAVIGRRPAIRPWTLWMGLVVAVVLALDLWRSSNGVRLLRYTLFATPAAYVVIAGAVRGRWAWVLPAVAVLAAVASLPSAYVPGWKIDLRTPVQAVGRRLGRGDGLVISGPDGVFDAVTFAAFQHYLPTMPDPSALLTRPADGPTLARLRRCPHVWVVWMWPDRPIAAFLPGYQTAEAGRLPALGEITMGRLPVSRPSPR